MNSDIKYKITEIINDLCSHNISKFDAVNRLFAIFANIKHEDIKNEI